MIVLYVTGHGYGHATRQAALAAALKRLRPDLDLEIRTRAPAWIFTEACPNLPVSAGGADVGLVQKDALDVDLEASLSAQLALGERWEALTAAEGAWLKRRGARLVVSDIDPLAFSAAAAAGLPSYGVSNFSWDWIFEPYAAADARWEPARRRCADAYALAEGVFRLPLHGEFPAFRRVTDVPLLSRIAPPPFHKTNARPLVLMAFGGFGLPLDLSAGEELSAFDFAGFGPKPRGLKAAWRELRGGTSADQLAAMAACDVVLCKPGYGMFSEALAHGKRLLYIQREGFREAAALTSGARARGASAGISRDGFAAGRWRAALEALLAEPAPAPVPADGADVVARLLLEKLK